VVAIMTNRAIVMVGVSQSRLLEPYVARFRETFKKYACCDRIYIYDKAWPPGSPCHLECNYGFKVHAVNHARSEGFQKILWFDSSCYAFAPLEPLWQRLERDGHVLIEDANALGKWSSDRSLEDFNVTRDQAMSMRLMCGTCWGVDLTFERSRIFLDKLLSCATPENFNGTHKSRLPGLTPHPRPKTGGAAVSNDERCWGHRSDEVYSALIANELNMKTHVGVEFIGGCGTPTETSCVRSGYDLPVTP